MKNKDITLKLNKREMEEIKKALELQSVQLRHNIYMHRVGQHKETAINSLYNIESVQNKIKKQGV